MPNNRQQFIGNLYFIASPILIFSLQRINTITETKNECIVNIPNSLELSKFIDKEFIVNNKVIYNLYGVVNHFGNIILVIIIAWSD